MKISAIQNANMRNAKPLFRAGKTTLLRVIAGILEAEEGFLRVGGTEI